MTNKKFASGAFVFTRARRGIVPCFPEEVVPIAERHGIDPSVIPAYAGDRAAVGRAIARTDTKVAGTQYLLRPIKRTGSEVTYGIVREDNNGDDHLDHDHEATVSWKAEPDPDVIFGNHTIANRVRIHYAELRGRLVSDDWTSCINAELEKLGACSMRDDGRVAWLPPQSLDAVRRLQAFLSEIGVTLIMAEVAAENAGVVTEVVAESVEESLVRLEREVSEFSETQKPSMFARRLEEYQNLRQKALLYQAALGIGAEKAEQVLGELERKVEAMLAVRTGMVVHKDGSVSRKDAPVATSRGLEAHGNDVAGGDKAQGPESQESEEASTSSSSIRRSLGEGGQTITTLTFAGANFVPADSDDPDVLVFTSGDEKAKASVAMLESMGLAGRWQKAGSVEVSVQNHGIEGADVSVRVRLGGGDIRGMTKALGALGIEVAA